MPEIGPQNATFFFRGKKVGVFLLPESGFSGIWVFVDFLGRF